MVKQTFFRLIFKYDVLSVVRPCAFSVNSVFCFIPVAMSEKVNNNRKINNTKNTRKKKLAEIISGEIILES